MKPLTIDSFKPEKIKAVSSKHFILSELTQCYSRYEPK